MKILRLISRNTWRHPLRTTLTVLGLAIGTPIAAVVGVLVSVVLALTVSLISAACHSIIVAAVYLYAAEGAVPGQFDEQSLQGAFGPKS